MTLEYAIELRREIRALKRLEAIITLSATTGPEWRYVLIAIDDRLRWDRYCVGLEDPQLIAAADAWLDAELVVAPSRTPADPIAADDGDAITDQLSRLMIH